MLNELYNLDKNIKTAGIQIEYRDDSFESCSANANTFVVRLDKNASVVGLDVISGVNKEETRDKRTKYKKVAWKNTGVSFPAFSVKPFLHAHTENLREQVHNLISALSSSKSQKSEMQALTTNLWNSCNNIWEQYLGDTINSCLKGYFQKDEPKRIKNIILRTPERYKAFSILLERAEKLTWGKLQDGIRRLIEQEIIRKSTNAALLLENLYVTTVDSIKAKRGLNPSLNVTLVLELDDWAIIPCGRPANHPEVMNWVKKQFLDYQEKTIVLKDERMTDAYGQPYSKNLDNLPYPSARIELLGNVNLRSMFKGKPCQHRYGKIDAAGFRTNWRTRIEMMGALEWIGQREYRKRTWISVSGLCGYKKKGNKTVPTPSVLFAYPAILTKESPPEIAGLFGDVDNEIGETNDAGFIAKAARVISYVEGVKKEAPNTEIKVFVLSKADQTSDRTKVIVSKSFKADRLGNSALAWQEGCQNIPQLNINIGIDNKDKAIWINPVIPFPTEVANCLNTIWFAEGEKVDNAYGVNIGDGLALLLEEGIVLQTLLNKAIRLAVVNSKTLLLALGHSSHRLDGSFKWNKDTAKYSKHASILPNILGLLLYKLGLKKGEYMSTAPFLVGQIMSLADTLHKEYCRNVRADKKQTGEKSENSGMPRQLIGNAAMAVAMDNPATGLARLAERILIYQSWANTNQNAGLAGWALSEFRNISEQLGKITQDAPLPERCSDPEKAQMLLGYLSRIGKED